MLFGSILARYQYLLMIEMIASLIKQKISLNDFLLPIPTTTITYPSSNAQQRSWGNFMERIWSGIIGLLSKRLSYWDVFSSDFFRWFLALPDAHSIDDISEKKLFHHTLPLLEGKMSELGNELNEFLNWDVTDADEFIIQIERWKPFFNKISSEFSIFPPKGIPHPLKIPKV